MPREYVIDEEEVCKFALVDYLRTSPHNTLNATRVITSMPVFVLTADDSAFVTMTSLDP